MSVSPSSYVERILSVIDLFGGATGHEIGELTGIPSPTACLFELGRKDLVYVTGETRRNGSGRRARVWDLTKNGYVQLRLASAEQFTLL
jgi:hypothetical protein